LAYEGKNGEINTINENDFIDNSDISLWAQLYVNKAAAAGLVNGMGNGQFAPKESAKREQAMVIIHRLLGN